MVGNHSKGKKMELECLKMLGVQGFIYPMGKYRKEGNDGLFCEDGYYVDPVTRALYFVQVCHKSKANHHRRAIETALQVNPLLANTELWLWTWEARRTKKNPTAEVIWELGGWWG